MSDLIAREGDAWTVTSPRTGRLYHTGSHKLALALASTFAFVAGGAR